MVAGVVFDMDGVLIDSEQVWDDARRRFVREVGGKWTASAQRDMMGMSSGEWSRYLHDALDCPYEPDEINDAVVERIAAEYRRGLPLIEGAARAVRRIGELWPLAIASSSNRPIIDLVLEMAGLAREFAATVSSDEVGKGKPAPDVYLEAARRLGLDPASCVAVEDSHNGMRSAKAAGMAVVAIPNRLFPPDPESLGMADVRLGSIDELTPDVVRDAG